MASMFLSSPPWYVWAFDGIADDWDIGLKLDPEIRIIKRA